MVETIAVLGAGPAGLMAAYELAKAGKKVTLYEKRKVEGGLCGTTQFHGKHGTYRFDFGGHRFITHDPALLQLVEDLVGDDLLTAYRKSVIRFRGRTYAYPLTLGNLLKTAPTSLLAGTGLDLVTLPFQKPNNANFATWIESRFGKTLYRNFFEGYTAKLWGIDPKDLSADWASQRISLLDLKDVARRLLPTHDATPRTYAHSYRYPKHGFGVIFEKITREFQNLGGTICYGTQIDAVECEQNRIASLSANGKKIIADQYLSTISLPDMVRLCGGKSRLKFRGVRFFCMPMETDNISDNTWQYLSDPHIMATRLQEPKRRSPYMAPAGHSSLMLEIPCDPGSELWQMDDASLFKRACADLDRLGVPSGLASGEYFSTFGAQAYPLMSVGYEIEREKAIAYLNSFDNLIQCGRQATFRYIFTDTAMEMGQMAARSVLDNQDLRRAIFDHRNERTVIETQSVAQETIMRLLLVLLFALTLSTQADAYSYSAAGKEPLIDGRNGIVSGFQANDNAKVDKYFNLMKDDIEFLGHKFDRTLLPDFEKAIEQKDQKAVLRSIHRLYGAEIQRRLIIGARNLDNYQSVKVMVIKSKRFFDVIKPELSKNLADEIETALNKSLDAIGKPGVFGAGQTPANPEAYKNALDDLVKAFAKI